jgi:hypothetical protein
MLISTPPAVVRPAAKAIPDVVTLFPEALKRMRSFDPPAFAKAQVYEADGVVAAKHGTTTAAGVVQWSFVFFTDNNTDPSATLSYGPAPKGFGRIVTSTSPFLEDVQITKVPKLSLAQAVARLDATKHTGAFDAVTLRNPLGPKATDPYYIFSFVAGPPIAVDVDTGQVLNFS